MSDNEIPEHLHLLSSYEMGWDGLNLIYEREPADEMPATQLHQHFIVMCLEDVRVGWWLNNSWQYIDYTQGDIAIFPANELFPKAQVSCEVGLVELFLEPATLACAAYEFVDADKIAASVHMSSHYFASLFKQSTGLTPYQYVTKCRIAKAKQLLHRHELTLVEICQQVGFQNQSHFTRVFRQHTSTTPKAYRKAR